MNLDRTLYSASLENNMESNKNGFFGFKNENREMYIILPSLSHSDKPLTC